MMEIPSIVLGDILTIAVVIFSAGGFYVATRSGMRTMAQSIAVLTEDVKELNKVVTQVAVQNQRIDNFSERLNIIERRYDDLRRSTPYKAVDISTV
jgi:uncharacterized protein Yka (UPF0111/DUF47 family)